MRRPRLLPAALAVAIGAAVAAGLFWALLNVPESNVLALTLTAALGLAAIASIGAAAALAAALGAGASAGDATWRSVSALPAFAAGLAVAGALWWLTAALDGWWLAHRGETDALFIRYVNVTRTSPLHTSVAWLLWFVRWGIGTSIVASMVTAAAVRPAAGLRAGLRNGVAIVPLITAGAIALLLSSAWPLVYWRPARIALGLEAVFVGAKLAILYAAAAVVIAAGLAVLRRIASARRAI